MANIRGHNVRPASLRKTCGHGSGKSPWPKCMVTTGGANSRLKFAAKFSDQSLRPEFLANTCGQSFLPKPVAKICGRILQPYFLASTCGQHSWIKFAAKTSGRKCCQKCLVYYQTLLKCIEIYWFAHCSSVVSILMALICSSNYSRQAIHVYMFPMTIQRILRNTPF